MRASSSSPISPVLAQIATAADANRLSGTGLLAALERVPDPRKRRGVRHEMTVILGLAVCAVLAGCRSFAAIGEWAANASEQVLAALQPHGRPPRESTIRRALQRLDGDELDTAVGAWAARRTEPPAGRRRALAVDGKTVRGSAGHADYLVLERNAHYLLTVKANQPALHSQLEALPWRDAPPAHTSTSRAHGRVEQRVVKVVTVATGIVFPHARQAIQITRKTHRLNSKKWRTEVVYAVTSLAFEQAAADEIAAWIRGHWTIENRLHWVRDVTYDEDRSQVRTGTEWPHSET